MTEMAVPADVLSTQRNALDLFGQTRHLQMFQPRNFSSWVFFYFLIVGAISTYHYFETGFEAVGTTAIIGLVTFALYAVPFVWMLRHLDRFTQLPAKLVAFGFLWGGVTATFYIALPANDALLSIYNKVVSATFAQDWGAGLAAPFTEETGKGLGILLLMFIAPRLIRTPFDGFILGGFVGLGFQIFENLSYAINESLNAFGSNEVGSAIKILVARGAVGVASHTLFSAIYGTGLVYLVGTPDTRPRRVTGIALILTAMVVHGVWDAAAAIAGEAGLNVIITIAGFIIIELTVLYLLFQRISNSENAWMHDLLGPEVARGTITEAELTAIAGNHHDRRQFVKQGHGHKGHKAARHLLEAGSDLAKAIVRSGGTDSAEVLHARSEIARLRAD